MALTEQNNISIAEICIYTPFLAVAIWLSTRHGFGRNAGWLYLIIFSLVRIIGGALQLATISDPANVSLHIGSSILATIGLSPLILVQLSLIGRALASIRKSRTTFLNENQMRLVQLLIIVGLILGAVGGSNAGTHYAQTGVYVVPSISKASIGLTIAGYILLVICTIIVASQVSYAEAGEKRLILAVGLSLPFILVRLIYSAMGTLSTNSSFNQLTGNTDIQLGMAIIMEIIVVIIVEGVGLTLKPIPKASSSHASNQRQNKPGEQYQMEDYPQRAGVSNRV